MDGPTADGDLLGNHRKRYVRFRTDIELSGSLDEGE
jgi:hypothetical protein